MRTGGLPDNRSVAGLYLLWLIVSGISLEEARRDEPERTMPRELGEPDFDERFEMLIEILVHGLAAG